MPKIKNIIIFTSIGAALVLIYVFFFRSSSDTAPLVSSSNGAPLTATSATNGNPNQNSAIARDFLNLLLSVKNIKLDDTIFSDVAFTSLHDSSITLTPDGTEGRPNPFAPIGVDNTASTQATTPASTTPATNTPPSAPILNINTKVPAKSPTN